MIIYENIFNGVIQKINNSLISPISLLRNYIPSNLLSEPIVKTVTYHDLKCLIINNDDDNNNGIDNDDDNDDNNDDGNQNISTKLYVISNNDNSLQPYGAWGNLFIEI